MRQRLSRGNRRLSFSPSEFLTAPQIRAECKQNNIKPDLYESYCGSILATAALGAAAFASADGMAMQLRAVLAPMLIAAVGIVLSIIGIFLVRTKEGATMRELLRSLNYSDCFFLTVI